MSGILANAGPPGATSSQFLPENTPSDHRCDFAFGFLHGFFFFFLIDLTFKIAWSQLIFKVHGRSLLLYVTNFINYVFLVF